MRERGKKDKEKVGRGGDKEAKTSEREQKKESWERVRSWCDFCGTWLGGGAIISAACKSILL